MRSIDYRVHLHPSRHPKVSLRSHKEDQMFLAVYWCLSVGLLSLFVHPSVSVVLCLLDPSLCNCLCITVCLHPLWSQNTHSPQSFMIPPLSCSSILWSFSYLITCIYCIAHLPQWELLQVKENTTVEPVLTVNYIEQLWVQYKTAGAPPLSWHRSNHTRGYSSCFIKRFHLLNCSIINF